VGSANVHDPTIIQIGGRYFCFHTSGNSFGVMRSSKDLREWKALGPILPSQPEWLKSRYRHQSIWAPDVLVLGSKLRVYYSASNWGVNQSVIGLAECENFNPEKPLEGWVDKGLVIESRTDKETYNAIDPETIVDEHGRHWMFFGSYFAGIYVVELDPATGKLKNNDLILVARNTSERGNPLEGAAVCRRDGYYYLFVSYGLAGQGVRSTYRIMVGRSRLPNGPFVDAGGKKMEDGGFVNVLKSSPPMFSPGHSDILQDTSGRWFMPYHFYDGRQNWRGDLWGRPTLQIREILWSPDGWPMPGLAMEYQIPGRERKDAVGKWIHQADFSGPGEIELKADGSIAGGRVPGRWEASGDRLTLKWTDADAPTGTWTDKLTLAYGNRYYVGRNDRGMVVRGIRAEAR
jgi:arabinan endo-1,5-alpha-L-arabinosidase